MKYAPPFAKKRQATMMAWMWRYVSTTGVKRSWNFQAQKIRWSTFKTINSWCSKATAIPSGAEEGRKDSTTSQNMKYAWTNRQPSTYIPMAINISSADKQMGNSHPKI